MEQQLSVRQSELCEMLRRDDDLLAKAFEALFARLADDDGRGSLRDAWNELDDELRARFRVEEELLLPVLELVLHNEATRLCDEHHQLLEELDRLGVDIDLHQLESTRVQAFLRLLRQHALSEQTLLHPWADERLSHQRKSDLIWRLRRRSERAPKSQVNGAAVLEVSRRAGSPQSTPSNQ
jgi:hypothetical protein